MELLEHLRKSFYHTKELDLKNTWQRTWSRTSYPWDEEATGYSLTDQFSSYSMRNDAVFSMQHRDYLISQWRRMLLYSTECNEAVDEIINEVIVYSDHDDTVEINLDKIEMPAKIRKKMKESFLKILDMLKFDKIGDELFKQWYVDGVINLEVIYDNANIKNGIKGLVLLTPFGFYKVKDPETEEIKYFYHNENHQGMTLTVHDIQNKISTAEDVYDEEQVVQVVSGLWSEDKMFSISHLHKAMKLVNQLKLIEDSLIVFRITRAPEKRVFYIDTGNLPKSKAEEYVKNLIMKYRQKKTYNVESGELEESPDTISVLEDYWIPRMNGSRGTEIDTITGSDSNLSDIADIDYFVNKLYKSLYVPRLRRDEQNRIVYTSNLDLERDEMRFHKFVVKLRRKFNELFLGLLKRDLLASKVMTIEEWDGIDGHILFNYLNDNEFSAIKKLQFTEQKLNIASIATGMLEQKLLSKKWIQKEILLFTDEEISEIEKQNEADPPEMMGMGGDMGMGMDGGMGDMPPEHQSGVPDEGGGELSQPPGGEEQL